MLSAFWMVFSLDAGPTQLTHPTIASARAEARRLATKHPGKIFYVLRAVAAFETPVPDVHEHLVSSGEQPQDFGGNLTIQEAEKHVQKHLREAYLGGLKVAKPEQLELF